MKRRLLIMFLLGCLLPFAVQAQHGTFRFAQITDIHFSPNNPNPTEDLLRSVAQINAIDSIDFVLVTGDITEEGDRTHYAESQRDIGFTESEVLRDPR